MHGVENRLVMIDSQRSKGGHHSASATRSWRNQQFAAADNHLKCDTQAADNNTQDAASNPFALQSVGIGNGDFISLKIMPCLLLRRSFSPGEMPALMLTLENQVEQARVNENVSTISEHSTSV